MSTHSGPLAPTRSATLAQRLWPILETLFDWLTLEPIWRAYRRRGIRGAAAVAVGLWFLWLFIVAVPLTIVGGLLELAGIVQSAGNAITTPVVLLATGITIYGAYNAYRFVDDRKTVYEYRQNLDLERAGECFDYLDSGDAVTRGLASAAIADAMGQSDEPGRVIKQAGLNKEEAAFTLVDLFHDDDDDVRRNASEAVAYFSREYPLTIAPYRDDVFAAMTYSDSMIQTNAAIIGGNMAASEPRLSDEVVDNLEPLVEDENPEVRQGMAMALGLVHTDRAKKLLERLTGDANADVRTRATKAREQQDQGRPLDVDVESS
jgi:26S proteasome regulatory complex component